MTIANTGPEPLFTQLPAMNRKLLFALAAASAVLSFATVFLPGSAGDLAAQWGAGLFYGLLVLAPWARTTAQRLALLISSALVYRGAVTLAVALADQWGGLAACTAAGFVGAVALGGVLAVSLRTIPTFAVAMRAAGAGTLGGFVFGLQFPLGSASLLEEPAILLGFAVWQIGFTLAAVATARTHSR